MSGKPIQTVSQTAGPFVHIGLVTPQAGFEVYENELGGDIALPDIPGQRICVEGAIYDGNDEPVKDAVIEFWQADGEGRFARPNANDGFRGWGRVGVDFETGQWRINTIKPGPVSEAEDTVHAPHICLWIIARGINIGLNTRLYFDDEKEANVSDPLLSIIENPERRATLMASSKAENRYHFNIKLQGDNETVFLDI
ncbi:MAG: protocatechuate 3,4-dioxygenase subunit alpha [Roseovarius sp.]|nr:protocatechuate 3,4-dioxygenase subunit alpha [Roseovarius sp.]